MPQIRLPRWLMPVAPRVLHLAARVVRPLTVGVRAVILDDRGRVFLVRHSYVRGWHCPGGAVEPGETVFEALRREVSEEANIEVEGDAVLHGIFFNRRASRRDHVVVYVVRRFAVRGPVTPGLEIVAGGFFDLGALPDDTSGATRARLAEILDGAPLVADW